MDAIRFQATIRYWNPEKASGLAVADVPAELVPAFGGLKRQHVEGTIDGRPFGSNVMPAGAAGSRSASARPCRTRPGSRSATRRPSR